MSTIDSAKLAINTATFDWRRALRPVLEAMDRADIRVVTPWRNQVQAYGLAESRRLLDDLGMQVASLCRAGFFTGGDGGTRADAVDRVRVAIDEAVAIGAQCLTVVPGGLLPRSRDLAAAHEIIAEGLAAVLSYARACGMPLALEPLHPMLAADRGCINSLAHANALCERLGAGVGIAVDVYHVWWDPCLEAELSRAGAARLMGFHLCDWLVPTTDLLLDRGMMGDGVADIPRIRRALEAAGFSGWHEVEIFSAENWWKREPDEVLRVCKERHRSAC